MRFSILPNLSAVISAYEPRGLARSMRLAQQINAHVDEVFVVVNSDGVESPTEPSREQSIGKSVFTVKRANTGMNIGAWSHGLSLCHPENVVLCLQDECELQREDFAEAYLKRLTEPGVGMVGDSLNPKWNLPWENLYQSALNYQMGEYQGRPVTRVDYYLDCFRRWGINPGTTGRHLRALSWGFSVAARQSLSRLPLGRHKEECIAAEIGVCRHVEENLGLSVTQIDSTPFWYFAHVEWDPSGFSKKA